VPALAPHGLHPDRRDWPIRPDRDREFPRFLPVSYLAVRDDVTALPAVPDSSSATPRRVLFATGSGARMYRAEVRALLRRLGQAAGLPADLAGSLSPHSMRHAFATLNQVSAGASLRDLQDAMGHASPRTTRRYDRSRGNLDRSPGYLLAGHLGQAC